MKKSEDKSLRMGQKMTKEKKGAIIESKGKQFCYPQYGLTVSAKDREDADKKIKKIIN